jgi:predicted kinase
MCGPSGSGKSTWIKDTVQAMKHNYVVVSRDEVRFSMVAEDEEYFSKENQVFNEFCKRINDAIEDKDVEVIFADATHLNEKSRNKTLNKLNLDNVDIYPVAMDIDVWTCVSQNDKRTGRAFVPHSVIRRMHAQFEPPVDGEKYNYKSILTVSRKGDE